MRSLLAALVLAVTGTAYGAPVAFDAAGLTLDSDDAWTHRVMDDGLYLVSPKKTSRVRFWTVSSNAEAEAVRDAMLAKWPESYPDVKIGVEDIAPTNGVPVTVTQATAVHEGKPVTLELRIAVGADGKHLVMFAVHHHVAGEDGSDVGTMLGTLRRS